MSGMAVASEMVEDGGAELDYQINTLQPAEVNLAL